MRLMDQWETPMPSLTKSSGQNRRHMKVRDWGTGVHTVLVLGGSSESVCLDKL